MRTLKLLTVDDSQSIRSIIKRTFQPYDLEIIEAENGAEGLSVARQAKPDLILLDLMMPVMDGFETLTELKKDPLLAGIPVIMLSAEASKANVLKVSQLGVRDYIVKPCSEETLIERVSRVIKLQRTQE